MEIITKFNIGDKVLYLTDEEVRKDEIKSFYIQVYPFDHLEKTSINIKITYVLGSKRERGEESLFKSAKEIINYLELFKLTDNGK